MQCDVHAHKGSASTPYLLDVQADLLRDLDTRVVVPLVRADAFGRKARGLHPVFEIEGEPFVMATHLMAAIRRRELGRVVTSLLDRRSEVIGAVDVLLSGV